jgi:hypothetical protein
MKPPASRETKPCPRCDEVAVFRDRVMRPNVAAHNHLLGSEFVAAWKCENEGCDYFEEWVSGTGGDGDHP